MTKRLIATIVLICLLAMAGPHTTARPEPEPVTAAMVIAPAVVKAIEAAVPVIPDLLNRIWSSPKRENDKMKQGELRDALTSLRGSLINEAKGKISPVAVISDELNVTMKFLAPAVTANESVISMQSRLITSLPTADPGWPALWRALQTEWDVAKAEFADVSKIPIDEINLVREVTLRQKLLGIRSLNRNQMIRVDRLLAEKNPAEVHQLRDALDKLSNTLRGVTSIVGIQISDLSKDIDALAEFAKQPPLQPPPPPSSPREKFLKVLEKSDQ